ncbi:MoaD/ThiS family protein [Thermosulfuriphilus ammonigenes]|uniref:MoaD/ThiS family protein n=1 Tax=Thermosulfuriphilus ammonigenes TaxID=1936021 RepID=A0A6G7PTU0_9BACT|nr:MoaD family protein [Thermosulfuriphilus ammonigenes]MBA2848772.1 molybdopterin synthase sulfur carrier subunit [Thermosulfuriphilus ammonigenes]QIJ71099.1 MoaD/ThiS family protein [Thermosulfuriphilus ammonigenes]HFB84068.1 MoaD/ThiS family protein [Thermodesulfatator sp.]
MRVILRFFGLLRLDLGRRDLSLDLPEGATVAEAIEEASRSLGPGLKERLLDAGRTQRGTIILLNGQNILYLRGLETELKDGDQIDLFPPGAGG